ncbi:MAG TPA: GntR family transcriptional regulator [Planctomycetota bacterium]|nr:GntR family transcriptional regulator [Planctomycetota bacterium]
MAKPSLPKYVSLKRELLKRIRSSKPGDIVESEHELVRRYSISRATVAKAIGELVAEGFLYREQGRGTFVAKAASTPDGPLGVIFCGPSPALRPGDYFGDIFAGLQETARAAGRDVLCMAGKTAPGEEFRPPTPAALAQRGLAGIALVGVDSDDHLAEVLSAGLPAVSVDYHTDRVEIDSVVGDAESGGYLGTKALIDAGHKRIAFLGHARHGSRAYMAPDQGSLERLAGYRRAHREAGIRVDEDLVFQPRQSELQLGGRLEKLAANGAEPTAAFSTGSLLLGELVAWAEKRGGRIEWIAAGQPTAGDTVGGRVWEDPVEMGRAAAKLVLDRIAGIGGPPRNVAVPSQIRPAPAAAR